MKINANRVWREIFLGALISVLLVLTLQGQTKKKPGGSSKTQPKKTTTESSERDLKPKAANSSTVSNSKKTSSSFYKDKRMALVIGNSEYESRPLRNPVNDARALAESLEALGFQVIVKENLTLSEMKAAIQDFSKQLPDGGVGLFYFAGHGIQIGGRNFLIPTDFNAAKSDVAKQAVEVDFVIKEITGRSGLNILILDACRNAPEGFTASTGQGLAEIKNAPAGTYIAFSTAPGKTAKDGAGENSPYAKSLVANLGLRPSRLEDVFIRTRIQMDNETKGEQTPWESSSIRTVFYFTEDIFASTQTFNPLDTSSLGRILSLPLVAPVFNESGKLVSQVRQNASYFVENRVGLDMMQIRGGKFSMGTSWEEIEAAYKNAKTNKQPISQESIAAEMPKHQVSVPGFFMSKTEITQAQWQSVMGSLPNIEENFRGANLPVVNVTWRQANQFCQKLSQMTGKIYRLPTEAEWEYGAKAGTDAPFAFGKTITAGFANFNGAFPFLSAGVSEFRNKLIPVGSLNNLNPFGLADMHGNVWEWTADNWHNDYNGAPTDGSVWEAEALADEDSDEEDPQMISVIRGGSWFSIASDCRSSSRRRQPQTVGSNKIGFRVVMQ